MCSLSCRPMSPGEMTLRSHFISFNKTMLLRGVNRPQTAQPPSIKFCGEISWQKPLIIDSTNEFEGGSGGNFEGKSKGFALSFFF